jgi:hypothetical protein
MDDRQIQQMMQNWQDKLAKDMDALRLRQWCVERAIQVVDAAFKHLRPADGDKIDANIDVVELSGAILKFITAPLFAPPTE